MADQSHSFISYYKRATSPLVVLLLLQEHTMYGYEISSEMAARSNGMFTIAVLYPVLYRLEELYRGRAHRSDRRPRADLLSDYRSWKAVPEAKSEGI